MTEIELEHHVSDIGSGVSSKLERKTGESCIGKEMFYILVIRGETKYTMGENIQVVMFICLYMYIYIYNRRRDKVRHGGKHTRCNVYLFIYIYI